MLLEDLAVGRADEHAVVARVGDREAAVGVRGDLAGERELARPRTERVQVLEAPAPQGPAGVVLGHERLDAPRRSRPRALPRTSARPRSPRGRRARASARPSPRTGPTSPAPGRRAPGARCGAARPPPAPPRGRARAGTSGSARRRRRARRPSAARARAAPRPPAGSSRSTASRSRAGPPGPGAPRARAPRPRSTPRRRAAAARAPEPCRPGYAGGSPAMAASSFGRSSATSSPPERPLEAHRRDPALLEVHPRARQVVDDLGEVRLVADDEEPLVRAHGQQELERVVPGEAPGPGRRARPPRRPAAAAARRAVSRARTFGLVKTAVERAPQRGQRPPGEHGLLLAPGGQRTLGVGPRRVRLRLTVAQEPELSGHPARRYRPHARAGVTYLSTRIAAPRQRRALRRRPGQPVLPVLHALDALR